MRRIFLLVAFLQGCGPAFVVGWSLDGGEGGAGSDGGEAGGEAEGEAATASIDQGTITDAGGSSPEASASAPDSSPTCTAIPFQARSNCPTASTGCTTASCSDPLLYAPSGFWLGCSSEPTPQECQCAETYSCPCLLAALAGSCKGTLLCDPGAAAPALFVRCVPGPDL